MRNNPKKVLLIDLDGVLNNYQGKFEENFIPTIKDGAYNFLEKLSKDYEIRIFTTRNKILTVKWLVYNKIDCFISEVTNVKDLAYLYIDDRAICFDGNYDDLIAKINDFRPYWK